MVTIVSTDDFANYSTCAVNQELDARGLRCPMPLLKAKQVLRDLAVGEVLRVLATDAGSWRDFQAYTQLSGHQLLAAVQEQGVYCYLIEKAAPQDKGR